MKMGVKRTVSLSLESGSKLPGTQRWPKEAAWAWFNRQPWPLGFNYIPATAINTTEMWQRETFDPRTIEREMGAAAFAGFNCARVFIQYLVWENDPEGLKARMRILMQIAAHHRIRVIWVLFDDCAFGTMTEPFLGKQPAVIPGEYANGWTPSPGPSRVVDRASWPSLERYVQDLMVTFRQDRRILAWDIYNEAGNSNIGNKSLPLLKAVFAWARGTKPSQPITSGIWSPQLTDFNKVILDNSDFISFHNYGGADAMTHQIDDLEKETRPIICTEWLLREGGSTVANILPILYNRRVGAVIWGLVNGKTQTNYHWGSKAGDPAPAVWQHDIFHDNLIPYDPSEIALFQHYARMRVSNALP
jgi:hypothetical protein